MAVRLSSPFSRIVGVGWPGGARPSLVLLTLFTKAGHFFVGPTAAADNIYSGLSWYVEPEPGQIAYVHTENIGNVPRTKWVNHFIQRPPSYFRKKAGPTAPAGYDGPQAQYLFRGHIVSGIPNASGFSERILGATSKLALDLGFSCKDDLYSGEYRLEWQSFWGQNVDAAQLTNHGDYWTYDGPYEVTESGALNLISGPGDNAYYDDIYPLPPGPGFGHHWRFKHVWTFDETTGGMTGPVVEI